jgi:Xaa-Pro dipeptidase
LATTTIERQQAAMDEFGFDALVAYSKENVAYGAGYVVPSQALSVRDRHFAVVVNRDGKAAMLLTSNELQEAQARSTITDFYPYDEFSEKPMEVLAKILRDLGVDGGSIGLEMDAVPADCWEELKRLLPEARWEHGSKAFQYARRIKTPDELERLRKVARIADRAQAAAHPHVREGMTEQEVYRLIADAALAEGAETIGAQVAAGDRSSYSNPTPGETKLRKGDVVKVDVFASLGGYLSDTGRAFVVADASSEQRAIWSAMQETLAAIHSAVKPGATTRDLWDVFAEGFGRHEMKPVIKFLGHGLGLSFHEQPFIAAHTETPLEAGMVFAVEPVYRVGDIGYHLEDNLIVTETGSENMTTSFGSDLIVLG